MKAFGFLLVVPVCVFAADLGSDRPVTFTKDVAPIFQEKCQECHRAGSMAPMSLVTFEEARPWAKSIRQRVVTRQMPPWHIDMTVGVEEVQERHVAVGRPDQHHHPLGGFGRTARRSRRTCRRPSSGPRQTSGNS